MMVPSEVANYLGKAVGDSVVLSLDLGSALGEAPLAKLLAIMTLEMDSVTVDLGKKVIKHNDT